MAGAERQGSPLQVDRKPRPDALWRLQGVRAAYRKQDQTQNSAGRGGQGPADKIRSKVDRGLCKTEIYRTRLSGSGGGRAAYQKRERSRKPPRTVAAKHKIRRDPQRFAAPLAAGEKRKISAGRRSVWIGGLSHCSLNKIARVILCGPENVIGISSGDRRGGVL